MKRVFGGGRVALSGLARHHKVRVQTVARPPTRQQVELWCKARKLIRDGGEVGENEEDQVWLNQTQHFKLRIGRDSAGSMGSELTCSLPSSPDTPQKSGDTLV